MSTADNGFKFRELLVHKMGNEVCFYFYISTADIAIHVTL